MKILITGKRTYGVAQALFEHYPLATFIGRNESGHDLTDMAVQKDVAEISLEHDVFINCSALWRFNQTLLLQTVFQHCWEEKHPIHIINIGSTVERVTKGRVSNYGHDKEALKNQSHEYSLVGVWNENAVVKCSYVSFGTMPTPNAMEQHPNRKKIELYEVADYIKWLVDQPKHLHVHELSVDPVQNNVS